MNRTRKSWLADLGIVLLTILGTILIGSRWPIDVGGYVIVFVVVLFAASFLYDVVRIAIRLPESHLSFLWLL